MAHPLQPAVAVTCSNKRTLPSPVPAGVSGHLPARGLTRDADQKVKCTKPAVPACDTAGSGPGSSALSVMWGLLAKAQGPRKSAKKKGHRWPKRGEGR